MYAALIWHTSTYVIRHHNHYQARIAIGAATGLCISECIFELTTFQKWMTIRLLYHILRTGFREKPFAQVVKGVFCSMTVVPMQESGLITLPAMWVCGIILLQK